MRAFWVTNKGIKPYKPEEHILALAGDNDLSPEDIAFKFIFWEDGGDHLPLLLVGSLELLGHPDLYEAGRRGMTLPLSSSANGAGDIDMASGRIAGWRSNHLDIDTPEKLKELIRTTLGATAEGV